MSGQHFPNWRMAGGGQIQRGALAFFRWWGAELKAMLPPRLAQLLERRRCALVVEFHAETACLWLDSGEGAERLEEVPEGERPTLPRVDRVELHLSQDALLETRLHLPLAAEENLREVLGFEMDRHTPFTAEQVYYDYRLRGRDREQGQLSIDLYLIPRDELDRRLALLASWGAPASTLSLLDEEGELRTLPGLLPPRGRGTRRGGSLALYGLGLLTGVLLVTVLLLPLVGKSELTARYEARLDNLQGVAAETQALRSQWQRLVERAGFLGLRRDAQPLAVAVLDELTRVIPDDTWIDRLQLESDGVKLQGESEAASNLLGLLEESSQFRDARFASPVTRNPRTGHERFVIELRFEEGESS